MQAEKNTQNQTNISHRQNPVIIILLAALVLAVLTGGVFLYLHENSKSQKSAASSAYQKGPHNLTYSKLETFKLDGTSVNLGISFLKPVEYKLALESDAKDQASFSHTLTSPTFAPLGALHVASVNSDGPVPTNYLKSINNVFSNPKDLAYKGAVKPIEDFVSTRFSPLYDLHYSNAIKYSSTTVKVNAWAFDLSATPKKVAKPTTSNNTPPPADAAAQLDSSKAAPLPTAKPDPNFENYKGRVIFAIGKSTYYYFVIYNTDYNWQNDQQTWQQVVDSIKIDQ